MSYRILVPLEFSEVDAEVIPYLRRFALRPDAGITLLHVLPDLLPWTREHVEAECGRARAQLDAFREGLDVDLPGLADELRMGEPASEILKFAALQQTDLIIMPAHGRKGFERLFHSSVTEAVLRRARCPLLFPRPGGGPPLEHNIGHLFDRILVPIDGSGSGFGIIPLVVEFARSYQSEVILFHDYADTSDAADFLGSGTIDMRIQDYRALLGYAGISVSTETSAAGRPVEDLLEAVSSTNADLIAMATHGRSGLERLTSGSLVEHVLRHAARPVLACNTSPGREPGNGERYVA